MQCMWVSPDEEMKVFYVGKGDEMAGRPNESKVVLCDGDEVEFDVALIPWLEGTLAEIKGLEEQA